jgi:2-polyprenyl-3-methyl-5-hydroxy-6-metoxy-1,4-benzoquinol methylase
MWMPHRSLYPEIMDSDNVSETDRAAFHRDLALIHKLLGNLKSVLRRIGHTTDPVRSIIDIGCGDGAVLAQLRDAVGAQVTGIDLRPPDKDVHGVPILQRDATCDALPPADVAISLLTLHHLTDGQVVSVIRNAARSCRRLICLDLVRHPLPFVLFTAFIGPLIHKAAADDGRQSIRRAFKPAELRELVASALQGTGATFEHEVSPYYAKQIVDIRFEGSPARAGV